MRENKCNKVIFAGKIDKPNLSKLKLDMTGIYYLPRIIKAYKKGDAAILKELINILSLENIKVIKSTFFTPELSLKKGNYTKNRPTKDDLTDIKKGENILKKIETAVKDGYQLILDGRTYCKSDGYYIGPTIFKDISNETDLSQNEIFGPVVSTQSWVEEEEVIHIANDTIYGLAAGIWSKDVAKAMRIADRIEAGTVYINNYFNAATQSPVGGFKQSGYGRENGWEGMRCFMQTKSVWLSTNPN